MNIHFLSFLLDVSSWGFIGLGIGYFVERTEGLGVIPYQYPVYLLTALLLGFIFSLNHALPEYGLSLPLFFEVCVGTILIAYGISRTFRKTVLG